MKNSVNVNWIEGMAFEANVDNHKLILDVDSSAGGLDSGPRPKALVLAALGGCTGMDVISILKKMKSGVKSFRMEIEADASEDHPKVYTNINVKYIFKGENLDMDKLKKAVDLSQEKYCSVSAMLKKGIRIDYSISVE